jgi:hypothetical protein
METVRQMYDAWAAEVMPADAPPEQVREMRRAFYSGVAIILVKMKEGIGSPDMSEEAGVLCLELMHGECKDFFDAVMAGRA